jgi:hypothetical protein
VQIGFNNDVEHQGTRYHVQTEDHGLADGRITSQVFRGGQILETITVSYAKAIEKSPDEDARDEEIRKRMKALHAHCFRMIKQGKYEAQPGGKPAPTPPEPVAQAAILDKPRMPAEPAPAPGLARVRPLTGLRSPSFTGEAPSERTNSTESAERSVSDTAEDEALIRPADIDELLDDEVHEIVTSVGPADLAGDDESEHEEDLIEISSLDDLPDGIVVAGTHDDLGEDFVAAHSRGVVMELDALADESAQGQSRASRRKVRRFAPMYSPAAAFRGLDVAPDLDLPRLLQSLSES